MVSKIPQLDETTKSYIEKLVYTVVSYATETVKAVETIKAINEDATLVVVGMYNPANGLKLNTGDAVINAGEIFEYVIDATNLYYATYAVADGGFAFVDVSDTTTAGFNTVIDASALDMTALTNMILDAGASMHANAEGHKYIKEQIDAALVCDYSVYEQLDADNHTVKCSICEHSYTEAHTFVDNVCEKCGYVKEVTPAPGPSGPSGNGGGGVSVSQFTIKFETNGGSPIAKVVVKKGELLTAPANPTKEGFEFDGWYTDKALTKKYDFAQPVEKSFTLYAKWIEAGLLSKFADLDPAAWYYEYVKTAVEKGLMKGVSETEFAPNGTLTRGMFVTILYRVEGEPTVETEGTFTDVAADQWYANAVKWANAKGIVKGMTETEFAPNLEVTREQMAAMIARYAEYKKLAAETSDVTYTDDAEVAEYAKDAVKVANKLGILIGNADGSFAPKKNATRAEAAALFVRLLDVLAK